MVPWNTSVIFKHFIKKIVTIVVVVVVVGAWVGRGGGLKQASDKDRQIPGQMGELFDS